MQYRITYHAHGNELAETIIVSSHRAMHALIDYANKWGDAIVLVEERDRPSRKWTLTNITQND